MEKDRWSQRECNQGASTGETDRSAHHHQEMKKKPRFKRGFL